MAASSFALVVLSVPGRGLALGLRQRRSPAPLPARLTSRGLRRRRAIALAASSGGGGLLLPGRASVALGRPAGPRLRAARAPACDAPSPARPGLRRGVVPRGRRARGVLGEGHALSPSIPLPPSRACSSPAASSAWAARGVPALARPRSGVRRRDPTRLGGALLAVYGIVARNRFGPPALRASSPCPR